MRGLPNTKSATPDVKITRNLEPKDVVGILEISAFLILAALLFVIGVFDFLEPILYIVNFLLRSVLSVICDRRVWLTEDSIRERDFSTAFAGRSSRFVTA